MDFRTSHDRNREGETWLRHGFSVLASERANRRRLFVFLGTFVVALAISLGVVWLRPAEYRASARLEITPATGSVSSGPSTSPAPESARPFLTETQILTSRPVLELAAARLARAGVRLPEGGSDPAAYIQSRLAAIPVPNTNVVELVATGAHPDVLAPLLDAIIDAYRERLAEAFRDSSAESMAQAKEEVRKLEETVASKRRELETFRARHNIVSLQRDENQVLAQVRNLGTSLGAANDRIANAEGKLRALTDAAAAGKTVVRARDDPTLASLEQRASMQREELRELERTFTPSYLAMDPKAVALRLRLAELERQIAVQRETGQRAALAEAQEELASAQAAAARMQEKISAGRKEVGQFTARFDEYKSQQDQLNAIETAYQEASRRLAKLDATESARMPAISLLEAAATPQEPWRPLYWRDTGLGTGASLVLAFLAMWLVEFFNRSEPQPTVILVQPQTGGLPYAGAPGALPLQHAAGSLDAPAPALLPRQAVLPRELDPNEVAALVRASDADSRLVVLLLLCGLSLDEALALRSADVDLARGLIRVGGQSARDLAVGEPLRALLAARTAERPSEWVLGHQDRPASPDAVQAQIFSAAHDAGIDGAIAVTAEALRHTYLAFLVRQGVRFADLPRIVGHLPAEVLGAYSALAPRGPRQSGEAINVAYPAFPPGETG